MPREQDLAPGRYVMMAVQRHRRWNRRGSAGAYLRAVLHDERDRQRNRAWASPLFWESSSKAAASFVASRKWARERHLVFFCRQCRGGGLRKAPAPELLPEAPQGLRSHSAGGRRRYCPQACADDSGGKRVRGSRRPQRAGRSGAVRIPRGPDRSALVRCGHAGTRRTRTRGKRPQIAARH